MGWPAAAGRLRIAHLSDLHLRTWNKVTKAAQRLLMALEYDLLAVTGDFGDDADQWRRPAELAKRLFDPVCPRYGTVAVLGNHDSPLLPERSDTNLIFLRNESRTIRHEGVPLMVAGVEQRGGAGTDVSAALNGSASRAPAILLAHYPSTVFRLPEGRIGLMLAGHTHGGQIRLPVVGCLAARDRIPRRMARGLHTVGATRLHVSAGIGCSPRLPARLMCPREISILTVRAARPDAAEPSECQFPAAEEPASVGNSVIPV
jgi:predicted MPP superfamily phosphohydrolase